ncbi:hypothetical protein FRB95_011765 [Tulasnella sp. JGI-2019a]|nr:hypothetical protein FRB95_011765 [Tulasnella sp. JGI-2019a]
MFWKFGFQQASSIDTLLDREDVSLELILDEDDLLQECKSQNTRLIDYFQRVDVLHRLLGYVSGEIEGSDKGRFKYPYVATEVLCSEIWSIVETCVTHSNELLAPFWDSVLNTSPGELRSKITLPTHFVKINAVFLSKKPEEVLHFIQSQPNVLERILAHIECQPFVDLIFRLFQLDEQPGGMDVVQWFASERLIPRLVAMLSPSQTIELHAVAADVLKGIIALATPSPGNFPSNPGSMSMLGSDPSMTLPLSNRLARELAHRDNVAKLVGFMLDSLPPATASNSGSPSPHPIDAASLPSAESAISSLINIIPVFIELIRKNNADFHEPYLFHTLRNRLIQVQQQQQFSQHTTSEEEDRDELEKAMAEMVDHLGMVHLGGLIEVIGSRLPEFQQLLKTPRSSIKPLATTTGSVVPLTFERFRICELYAEVLHCSNMTLLNRQPDIGPAYDDQGRLQGGLKALEDLARVCNPEFNGEESPQNYEPQEDPAFDVTETRVVSVSPTRSGDSDSSGTEGDGVTSDDVDDVLEDVHFDDDEPSTSHDITPGLDRPSVPRPNSAPQSPLRQFSGLNLAEGPPRDVSMQSPRSDTTVVKPENPIRKAPPPRPAAHGLLPGDTLKQKFLDLGIVSTLLDLFFEFPLNNFLHNVVYDLLHQILTGRVDKGLNRKLVKSLFRDSQILQRIIDGQRQNDEACSKPKGVRAAYMGHLTLISEDIVSAFEHYPPELIDILSTYAPRPEWDQYVTGKYKETRDNDSLQLGGGKPVIGLGLANFPGILAGAKKKVDEGDGFVLRSASAPEGTSSNHARFEEPEADDSATGQFARYLAQQITPQDQFSSNSSDRSSSDEEDDGAWLDAANRNFHFDESGDFDLAPPPSPGARRRSNAGFDDAFNPISIPSSHDPFATDSDDDDAAWGPFSDSAAAHDTTGSASSSFTLSTSEVEGFDDSFGDDFGDFQGGGNSVSTVEIPPTDDDDDEGGEHTPTARTTFQFDHDFEENLFGGEETDELSFSSPANTNAMLHGSSNGAPLERQYTSSHS